MKCPYCAYEWESRIPNPVECPRCKGRLDYLPQRATMRAPKLIEKRGGEKAMPKFPLIPVTVVIIIVAVGAWALWPTAPSVPAGAASITGIAGAGTVFADDIPASNASGIENIYIVENARFTNEVENWADYLDNCLGVITGSGLSTDIPYENAFVIVVAVKAGSDNMAYVRIDNMNVGLAASGAFTIPDENAQAPNKHDNAHMALTYHAASGYDTSTGWLRINAIWDNNGNGYVLHAGETLNLSNIRLWGWA